MVSRTESEKAPDARRTIPFAWRLVKCYQTQYCSPTWLAEHGVKACGVYYLYDANRHIHICSLTPSYELIPVSAFAEPIDGYLDIENEDEQDEQERRRERLNDLEMELLTYEELVTYSDVSTVDRMRSEPFDGGIQEDRDREDDESDEVYYQRQAEGLREHLQGNPPCF